MVVIGANVLRTGSAASLEGTGSNSARKEAFIQQQRKRSGKIANAGVGEGEKDVRMAAQRRGSKRPPQGMRVVARLSVERREKRAKRFDGTAGMGAGEGDISHSLRMEAVNELKSVKAELKTMKEHHCRLMVRSKLMQELDWVRVELKGKNGLIKSFWIAANAREHGGGGQRRGQGEVRTSRVYEIFVQEGCYGFVRVVYDRVMAYTELETAELCSD